MAARRVSGFVLAGFLLLAAVVIASSGQTASSAGMPVSPMSPAPRPLGDDAGAVTARTLTRLRQEMRRRNYAAVTRGCREIIAREPSAAPAYGLMVRAASARDLEPGAAGELDAAERFLAGLAKADAANPYYVWGLGLCQRARRNYLKAMAFFEDALRLGGDFWEGYEKLIDYCQYKGDLEKIRDLLAARPSAGKSAPLQAALGLIAFRLSDYAEARSRCEKSLALYRKSGDLRGEAWSLCQLSDAAYYLNEYDLSLRLAADALRVARSGGAVEEEIDTLYLESFVRLSFGSYDHALRLANQALALCDGDCDPVRKQLLNNALANIYLERGDLGKAQELLESTLAYFTDADELFYQMKCHYWLSVVLYEKGEYIRALASARKALDLSRQLGFRTGDVFHLTSLADISLSLGNDSKSLQYSRDALALAGGKVGKWSEEKSLNTIGHIYLKKGRSREALGYFLQALDFIRRIGHRREEPKCLYNVGFAYLKMGDGKAAAEYLGECLTAAGRQGNRIIRAFCANALGELALGRGDAAGAVSRYGEALKLGQEMAHPVIMIDAYAGMGAAREAAGAPAQALASYEHAVAIIEDLRGQLRFREYSAGFFENKVRVYEDLMDLYARLDAETPGRGYDRECFYFAEKARARAFLDDMRSAEVAPRSDSVTQSLQYEIDILSHRASKIITNLYSSDLDDVQRAGLRQELAVTEEGLQTAWADYARLADAGGSRVAPSPRCEDVQTTLLDDKTALVEYFVGGKTVFMFLVTKGNLSVRRVPAAGFRATLTQAENYRNLLSMRDETGFAGREAGEQLYGSLFKSLRDAMPPGIARVIVVPDGELCSLPFESLVCGAYGGRPRFLLEDYDISYSPSASILLRIAGMSPVPGKEMDLLAVGNPVFGTAAGGSGSVDQAAVVRDYYLDGRFEIYPLKFAESEIASISRFFRRPRTSVLTGAKATEEAVKAARLSDYRILHFATHSLLDTYVSSRSALVLTLDTDPAEDGFFQAREIYDLKLDADLVVLSACQTARGVTEKGEGLSGLARSFFCAGARSVLASLWDVNDKSTGLFMKKFYGFLGAGLSKEKALRRAKLEMMKTRFSHPYHWASFILMGESASIVPFGPY